MTINDTFAVPVIMIIISMIGVGIILILSGSEKK